MSREDEDKCAACGVTRVVRVGHNVVARDDAFVEPTRAEAPMCYRTTCRFYGQRHATAHEARDEAPQGETRPAGVFDLIEVTRGKYARTVAEAEAWRYVRASQSTSVVPPCCVHGIAGNDACQDCRAAQLEAPQGETVRDAMARWAERAPKEAAFMESLASAQPETGDDYGDTGNASIDAAYAAGVKAGRAAENEACVEWVLEHCGDNAANSLIVARRGGGR
jgi:hypothetical protein